MIDQALTLADLSERSGVEIRTLRSWMQQGVIPGPETVGRNARYAATALTRVLAVKAMREVYGLSLAEIRRDLLAADEDRVAAYAALASGSHTLAATPAPAGEGASPNEAAPAPQPAPPPSASSAADYLRSLRSAGVFGQTNQPRSAAVNPSASPPIRPASPFLHRARALPADRREAGAPASAAAPPARDDAVRAHAPVFGGSRLARLAEALERVAGSRPARRKARGEVRLHIPITPDLDLVVRGDHSADEIARFEQVADLLRTILTGGSDHD